MYERRHGRDHPRHCRSGRTTLSLWSGASFEGLPGNAGVMFLVDRDAGAALALTLRAAAAATDQRPGSVRPSAAGPRAGPNSRRPGRCWPRSSGGADLLERPGHCGRLAGAVRVESADPGADCPGVGPLVHGKIRHIPGRCRRRGRCSDPWEGRQFGDDCGARAKTPPRSQGAER